MLCLYHIRPIMIVPIYDLKFHFDTTLNLIIWSKLFMLTILKLFELNVCTNSGLICCCWCIYLHACAKWQLRACKRMLQHWMSFESNDWLVMTLLAWIMMYATSSTWFLHLFSGLIRVVKMLELLWKWVTHNVFFFSWGCRCFVHLFLHMIDFLIPNNLLLFLGVVFACVIHLSLFQLMISFCLSFQNNNGSSL